MYKIADKITNWQGLYSTDYYSIKSFTVVSNSSSLIIL